MDNTLLLVLMPLFVALNAIIIIVEFKKRSYTKFVVDLALLIAVAILFSGSFNALVVGTFGSFIISMYLFFSSPITFRRST